MLHAHDESVRAHLLEGGFGLEKESLRIDGGGFLAHTPADFADDVHIVRDFSENQVEVNTPVCATPAEAIQSLEHYNGLVQRAIANLPERELLWPFSNPPYILNEKDIPIAQYFGDDAGKTEYREYLSDRYGRYNAVNSGGYLSWYDFACAIFRAAGIPMTVLPVTSEEYGQSRAVRPRNSRLDTAKLAAAGFRPLPDWQDALARYLGQDADGAERYGMELQATLQLEVYSPGRRAGALCERAAAQVVDVFLGGIEGLYSGDLELGRTAYDARTDCFRCAVRAPLTLRLYTTAQDGAFTHADIRGVLQ